MPNPVDKIVPAVLPGQANSPAGNILSLSLPTDLLTGAGGGGLNLSYNFGPNADTIAQNAYSFLGQQSAGALAFENNAITGTQSFMSAQTMPIINAVSGEADKYFSQILGAYGTSMGVQQNLGNASISAEQQVANASINASKKAQKGGSLLGAIFGGCYITTAICKRSGLPDDCETLQTLRHWRDTWMQETPERRALVTQYYEKAPGYVDAISALPEYQQSVVWDTLETLIEECATQIHCKQYELALCYYLSAVEFARAASEYVQ